IIITIIAIVPIVAAIPAVGTTPVSAAPIRAATGTVAITAAAISAAISAAVSVAVSIAIAAATSSATAAAARRWGNAVPASLDDPNARIRVDIIAVGPHRRRAHDFPLARPVIEAPEGGRRAGRQLLARFGIGQVGKAHWQWLIEVERAVRLNGNI